MSGPFNFSGFNAAGDFAEVVDSLETITLARRDSEDTVSLPTARRIRASEQEAEPSGGFATQADAVWRTPLPAETARPRLGDALVDAAGQRWTILAQQELPRLGLWQFTTRELRVANGLNDSVDVQRATYVEVGGELEIDEWTTIATNVPVRIQPLATSVDRGTTPPTEVARFTILLGDEVTLEPADRFVDENDVVYWLERFEQAVRIDALPVATVVREEG